MRTWVLRENYPQATSILSTIAPPYDIDSSVVVEK
jgi:hypothetical protein